MHRVNSSAIMNSGVPTEATYRGASAAFSSLDPKLGGQAEGVGGGLGSINREFEGPNNRAGGASRQSERPRDRAWSSGGLPWRSRDGPKAKTADAGRVSCVHLYFFFL